MPILTSAQAQSYAVQAGFSGQSLATIIAIAQAESSLNTAAQHTNSDSSIDRGILQINSRWHPEINDSCAYDPACAFQSGYRISSRGSDFSAWSTYTSGVYLRYLSSSSGATNLATNTPWYKEPVTHGYYSNYDPNIFDTPHFAVDLAVPFHTPLSFLEPGTIKKADFQPWGGEVFEQPDAPGRPQEYHYHLDTITVSPGQHVAAYQTIGLSGGQTSGGDHPVTDGESTGAHDHFGEFTGYINTPVGTRPYGPDPTPLLTAAGGSGVTIVADTSTTTTSDSTGGGSTPESISTRVNQLLSEAPGFSGIARALDAAEQFPGVIWYNPGTTVQIVPGGSVGDFINGAASAIFDPGDYIGAAFRSILDTVMSNLIALFFRSVFVVAGMLLIAALLWKAVDSTGLVGDAAGIASKVAA